MLFLSLNVSILIIDMKWERGDISFVFNGNHIHHKIVGGGNNNSSPLVVMDNKLKVYQLMSSKVLAVRNTNCLTLNEDISF